MPVPAVPEPPSAAAAFASAVIVAAGRGTRFGPEADKLFLEVAGQPVVAHAWEAFDASPAVDEVILVVRAGMEGAFEELAAGRRRHKPWRLARGGKERQDSVWNGVLATSARADVVAIHDGARPCVPPDLIAATLGAARETGAAVAAQRVTDTLKESEDGRHISRTLDRSRLWSVQTPQAFRRAVFLRAFEALRATGLTVTDDTAACELIGQPVRLVESRAPNPKVTYPGDLPGIEALLARRGARP